MTSFIKALDQHTPKNLGEKGHIQEGWSNDLRKQICQLYFQLVRCEDHKSLESSWVKILESFIGKECDRIDDFKVVIKMVANVRDIKDGKGECQLSYMMLYHLYIYYPDLAQLIFRKFLNLKSDTHCLGSYKDIKYMCEYIKNKTDNDNHPFIVYILEYSSTVLKKEETNYNTGNKNSLLAKWLPRSKSKKFGWIFNKLALIYYPHFFTTVKTSLQRNMAYKKAKTNLRKLLSKINKHIDTIQIRMAGQDWKNINFGKVTGPTLRVHKKAFQNVDKKGCQRSTSEDRIKCSQNLKTYIEDSKNGIGVVKGKRVDMFKLVKDAITASNQVEIDMVNEQWKDNSSINVESDHFIIPIGDTSGSMEQDNMIPIYNSIGFSIRVSEKTHPAFKHRIMTFNTNPTWFQLNENMTFHQKVKVMKKDNNWGGHTNFYKAMELILNVCLENNIPPTDVEKMILAVFSDMQMDVAQGSINMTIMMENIKLLFSEAGMKSIWRKPYPVPHILLWNLKKTNGFPNCVYEKNTTMISGYSPVMLNAFSEKGFDDLKSITPFKMLEGILRNNRYKFVDIPVTMVYQNLKKLQ